MLKVKRLGQRREGPPEARKVRFQWEKSVDSDLIAQWPRVQESWEFSCFYTSVVSSDSPFLLSQMPQPTFQATAYPLRCCRWTGFPTLQ